MNIQDIVQAKDEWDLFKASFKELSNKQKTEFSAIDDNAAALNLISYVAKNQHSRFDSAIHRLPKQLVFQTEYIPIIVNYYLKRELHELAYQFANDALEYHKTTNQEIPSILSKLKSEIESKKLLNELKISFGNIRNLEAKNIPVVTPDILNNKKNLNSFILNEILKALLVLVEKKEAVRQISHENRFNDYVYAILKLRLPVWGWIISEQTRRGTSLGGKDAGEVDLLIQSGGGDDLSLVEALFFKDKTYNQNHLVKCPHYSRNLSTYYVLIYHTKSLNEFENDWLQYQEQAISAPYTPDMAINTDKGFIDIADEFDNIDAIKVQQTFHGTGKILYHIMVSLGERTT
jgi:hypothetical protein